MVAQTSAYWANQIKIQEISAQAWLALEQGKQVMALSLMQRAAGLEASTVKHATTPGEVLPARELLGDMLLKLERPEEALPEYAAALERSPNRFNSLYGAGRSAELAGNEKEAVAYYLKLLEVADQADTERPRLRHARRVLDQGFARRSE